jgi:hypothetical protein
MHNNDRLSPNEIWLQGCRGERLSRRDQKHFSEMARSRFYTFQMSAGHARQTRASADADHWIGLLVRGLATELKDNPGLEREWLASDYPDHVDGRRVTLVLNSH